MFIPCPTRCTHTSFNPAAICPLNLLPCSPPLPQVVELLAHPSLAPLALGLAYHLSMVEAARPAFVFSDALPK